MACNVTPTLTTVAVPGTGTRARLVIPQDVRSFALQVRTAVGLTIALEASESADYFSLAAGATFSQDDLKLTHDLELWLDAPSAVVAELWSWT